MESEGEKQNQQISNIVLPRKLSAAYKNEFAYPSIKDRLPVILTKVVDTIYRSKHDVKEKHGEKGVEELKNLISQISKLRSELQTDKPFLLIDDDLPDKEIWNDRIKVPNTIENPIDCLDASLLSSPTSLSSNVSSWFTSSWMLTECYGYRRVASAASTCKVLKNIDPFKVQKDSSLIESKGAIISLSKFLLDKLPTAVSNNEVSEMLFKSLFYASLWGNKCDLSISFGESNNQTINVLEQLEPLMSYILCNDGDKVFTYLNSLNTALDNNSLTKTLKRIDIILDNAGFELFTDLCLAEYFSAVLKVEKVFFHFKMTPWFVSDVTNSDLCWTLNWLNNSDCPELVKLSTLWNNRVSNKQWVFTTHYFWTLPDTCDLMKSVAPDLFEDLSQSNLIIFKGDLNYRKVTGDRNWPFTTCFSKTLRGFNPSSLCTLRTLKSDTVVGLSSEAVRRAKEESSNWMVTGQFGVIQSFLLDPLLSP